MVLSSYRAIELPAMVRLRGAVKIQKTLKETRMLYWEFLEKYEVYLDPADYRYRIVALGK